MKKLFLLLPLLLLAGCINAYVENVPPAVDYKDIKTETKPIPVTLETHALSNGEKNENGEKKLADKAREVLNNSKVFTVVDDNSALGIINITLEERFSSGGAFAKGFLTGFTFGLVGTTSSADIMMDISLSAPNKTPIVKQYTQKMYVTAGLTAGTPDNSTEISPASGYDDIVKKLVLTYVKDLQQNNGY